MINRILIFILTKIYKINPRMLNPINWRVATSEERISNFLNFQPLIYTSWQSGQQYGFENVVFLGLGRVYLVPNLFSDSYPINKEKSDVAETLTKMHYGCDLPQYTLFRNYITTNPNILVNRFQTRLLIIFLKRASKYQIKQIKTKKNEKSESSEVPDFPDLSSDQLSKFMSGRNF